MSIQRWIPTILLGVAVSLIWPAPPLLAHDTVHTVELGETLSEIAQQHDSDVSTLRRLNHLDDADFVWAGQQIDLPMDVTVATAAATVESSTVPADTSTSDASEVAESSSRFALPPLNGLELFPAFRPMPEPERPPSSQAADRTLEHIVQPGEYLGTIAALHDTTPQAIAEANRLANPSLIVSGQRLVIPEEETPQGATATIQTVPAYHVHRDFPTETDKWIDVDLREQRVVAYEGRTPIQDFIISSGLPGTPTVTGTYRIWAKVALQDMSGGNRAAGDDYYLEDVPWVQYFFEEYAFHGAYWHNNFGQPMSRGCINMRVEDAKWLFEWTSPVADGDTWTLSADTQPGTLVLIHD